MDDLFNSAFCSRLGVSSPKRIVQNVFPLNMGTSAPMTCRPAGHLQRPWFVHESQHLMVPHHSPLLRFLHWCATIPLPPFLRAALVKLLCDLTNQIRSLFLESLCPQLCIHASRNHLILHWQKQIQNFLCPGRSALIQIDIGLNMVKSIKTCWNVCLN